MNFGASTWVWASPLTTELLAKLIPHVAKLGFDWIELPIENPGDFDYSCVAELLRDFDLGVSVCAVMGFGRDLIHPDPKVRASTTAYIRHCIEAVCTLGGSNVVGPMYSEVGRRWRSTAEQREEDVVLLIGQLEPLADYAVDHGAVLCIEPVNRFETSFINTASQAVELVDRVGHPACGMVLDTFHMNIEEKSTGDAIRSAGHRLRHLHACENDRGTPGKGQVPWVEVAKALRDIHYDGAVIIESFTFDVKSIADATGMWRPMAPSQDALARDGLAFLQTLFLMQSDMHSDTNGEGQCQHVN